MFQKFMDDVRDRAGSALQLTSLAAAIAVSLFITAAFLCAAAFVFVLQNYGLLQACLAGAGVFFVAALLAAICYAIKRSETVLGRESELHALRAVYGSLTQREREVMSLVVTGLLNKEVGGELGISEITVKAHRGSLMRKMQAATFVDLVKMAARLRIARPVVASAA